MALSAILDGEDPGVDRTDLDAHLRGCAQCAAWQVSAQNATEATRARWRAEADVPDRTAQVLAAVAAGVAPARPAGGAHTGVLRWALAISAAAQLLLALPAMVADPSAGDAALHTGREMASFDVAVAIGFLFVAWRPAWAQALVPVAVALAGCLLLTSAIDVSGGAAQLGHELNHLLAGVQAVLLWILSRTDRTPAGPEPFPGGGPDRTVAGPAASA